MEYLDEQKTFHLDEQKTFHLELEDLVYTYPDINNTGFQTEISAKEEFKEVAALTREDVPKRGQLFRHQTFIKRFMRQYDEQFIFHQTGTGKTCTTIGVVEYYKKIAEELAETLSDDTIPYKKAVVLVKGDNLANEFKTQLLCKCTDGDYITDAILDSKNERQRKNNITRSVSRFYTITTYEKFAKQLFRMTDSQLHNEFDHTIFIVDEVHNINKDLTQTKFKIDKVTLNKYYYNLETKGGETREVIVTSRLIYDQLWRLFHTVFPRKVMLLSATPMINDVSEIGPRLNLLLAQDKQIPDDTNFKTITLEEFKPYLQGIVSFVRQLDTGAVPVYRGKVIDATYDIDGENVKAQMVVYATKMASKQLKTYKLAESDPQALRPNSSTTDAFDDLKRQAANFTFPDGSTGTQGFEKYVIEEGNQFRANDELYQWISVFKYLQALSNKYATIINACKINKGNCWCYSNYIVGSGAIVLGLCFEAQGFERFDEVRSIFADVGFRGIQDLCGGNNKDKNRKVRISKGLRYGLLTSKTTGPEAAALLEAFNSYENRHGEYIKAIIGSPVTRDGLNLANVLQIHLVGPGWNQAGSYQAISRAIRSTSHVDLLEEERERYRRRGKDPSKAYVNIDVYRHASVDKDNTSIDIHMYEISEKKDREIKRVVRMMKQCAVDCQVNYDRNVRPDDVDGSATCDYDVCNYKCIDPLPDYTDYSSYDVLYSGEVINRIKQEVKDIFRLIFSLPYKSLYNELDYRNKFIDLAVSELIIHKESIVDRFGTISYLREDRGTLFLRKDYPLSIEEQAGNLTLSEYTSTILGILPMSLGKYNGQSQNIQQANIIRRLARQVNTPKFSQTIDELSLDNKIALLETAMYLYGVENNTSDYIEAILSKFKPFIFSTKEPIGSLEVAAEALSNRGRGRGRKPQPGSKFKLNDETEEEVLRALNKKGPETVYFHNLTSAIESLTAYSVTSKSRKSEGKIRLIKASEGGWRDANEYEDAVYNTIIKDQTEKDEKKLTNQFDIYGTVMYDGKFRIVDKTTEDTEQASTDTRKINRGKICSNGWKKKDLINVLWKLSINPFKVKDNLTRKQLERYMSQNKYLSKDELAEIDDEELRFKYIWYSSGMGRREICELLQKELEKMGRLIK